MPIWWKRKPKSRQKPKPNSSPKTKEAEEAAAAAVVGAEEVETPRFGRGKKKEKANSFDEILLPRKSGDQSPVVGGRAAGRGSVLPGPVFALGHPLPRPSSISSLPLPHEHGAAAAGSGSASASGSSISSSGSSEETPDLGFYRYSDQMNMLRGGHTIPDSQRYQHVTEDKHILSCSPILEHPRCPEIFIPSRKEFQVHGIDASFNVATHCQTSTETTFSARTPRSSTPGSRGHPSPTSPVHPRAFGLSLGSPTRRHDDLKSPPHPLPLPPGSPRSSSSRPPQSQWRKGKLLGRGTFGHVYLGFNSESGQMCAIKEVKVISDDSNSNESLKQLNQEITLLSQLSHANIVQYYGSELVDCTLSVYLEYVSGGSIHKLLQEYGPFNEPVIRNYTGQILSGLAYLHGRKTVHRDIKGANILVDPNGEIKLADFGMAKHMSAYTSIRSFKGSPYWMAPEVIMNGNGYNLSVDIWSLGCTVLEMATSKPPWSQYEGVAAIFKIGNSKDIPEIPDHLSRDGKSFLKLCLQRDPSARPTAVQLMDHPFVRDQRAIKAAKFNLMRDTMNTADLSSTSSISPQNDRDYGMRHVAGFPSAFPSTYRATSDQMSMRMNMSLPVSPCSSPLRQYKQSNRSCLPSPPHPSYSAGAALYPMRPSKNLLDPWPDVSLPKTQAPYDSPRRLSMGL